MGEDIKNVAYMPFTDVVPDNIMLVNLPWRRQDVYDPDDHTKSEKYTDQNVFIGMILPDEDEKVENKQGNADD